MSVLGCLCLGIIGAKVWPFLKPSSSLHCDRDRTSDSRHFSSEVRKLTWG
uniref:Uncharacterized protein n=1 Tax=Anguilla anguilla TaxID=7936 RepID=A0A0E9VZS0_ANGAN